MYYNIIFSFMRRDRVVGVVTNCGLGGLGFGSRLGQSKLGFTAPTTVNLTPAHENNADTRYNKIYLILA